MLNWAFQYWTALSLLSISASTPINSTLLAMLLNVCMHARRDHESILQKLSRTKLPRGILEFHWCQVRDEEQDPMKSGGR
jgi:hypothetical protein